MEPQYLVNGRMCVGQVSRNTAHNSIFEVKKLGIDTYCLKRVGENRMRFGTLAEIREDVAYTLESGAMPRAKTNVH